MYVNALFSFRERNDLVFCNESTDTLFVEIDLKHGKNVVIGVVYKAPNSDPVSFNEMLGECVETIARENKLCYIVGDFNYDIINCKFSYQ